MVKIGVISDTHIPARADSVPQEVLSLFKDVDMIIHAGDITQISVLDQLRALAPVHAVCGNMDGADLKHILPQKKIIEVENKRIGIYHGGGAPFGLKKRIRHMFRYNDVDCIVFGHTHQAENKHHKGILFFNPGSATDKIFSKTQSIGLLFVDRFKDIRGEIISF